MRLRFLLIAMVFVLISLGLNAQTIWGYNYGTGSTSFTTANSNSTTFFPSTPSGGGTYRVRTSTSGGGGFYRDDPGLSSLGADTELRIVAPTTSGSSGINKYAVYGYPRQRNAYYRTTMRFGNSTGGFADSGTFYFYHGDGTSFENDAVATVAETCVGIRWVLGPGGTVTASYASGASWVSLGYTFVQGVNYTVEYRIHAGPGNAGSGKTYVYNGVTYTTTIYTYDMWINGTRVAGIPHANGSSSNLWLDSFMYYGESSTGNVGNLFLDDSSYTDAIDVVNAPIYYSKSTGALNTLATWGLNTDGTGTSPTNFTSPSIGYYIRNNPSPTLTANWVVSGSAARVELGDGTNACTFTVPSAYTYTGPIDVNNLGVLNLQNTTYPSIGLLNSGSTVRYSATGNQNVLGLNYYNLSIRGTGTKTLVNNAFVSNLTDVGDGTNATTLTVPAAYSLSSTVNVLNAGTLDIQNTVIPTMGTLSSGSTVRYSGTLNQNVVPASYSILEAYGTGNKTLTGNITVGNRAYVGNGTDAVTLTVPAAYTLTGTVDVNSNAILDIENFTVPTLGTLATGSTVRYSYAGNQNVTGTTYYNMDVDNGFTKTMQHDVTVTNISFANAGTLALNNYNLYLAGKYISFYSTNAVFSDLTANYVNSQVAGMGCGRIWTTNGSFTNSVDVTFTFPYATTPASMFLWFKGDGNVWTKGVSVTPSYNAGIATITVSGLSTISGGGAKGDMSWTFGEIDETLPVELSSFTAILTAQNYVQLMWVTQSETNVSGFRIFRNTTDDLEAATMLNTFISATNTSQMQVYVYNDEEVSQDGTFYYWLQNLDLDGSSAYYGPTMITVAGIEPVTPPVPITRGIANAYPNPFNPSVTVQYGIVRGGIASIDVFNQRGQLVRNLHNGFKESGNYSVVWNGLDNAGRELPSGVYNIRLVTDGKAYGHKVIFLK